MSFRRSLTFTVLAALGGSLSACSASPDDVPSRELDDTVDGAIGTGNITTNSDANALAAAFQAVGSAITVTSAEYKGAANAAGTYTQGPLGIPDGVLLTTGSASLAAAPNDRTNTSKSNGRAGSPLCDALMDGGSSFDATKLTLTFDLAEGFDGVSLLSIFGSEEYKEYVGTAYNDVYGVYVNGKQVAFDAKGEPITINGPFFSSGEVVVGAATETEYDGSTGLLQTKAALAGGTTGNVIEVVVCDGGDRYYDSGVLVAALNGCVGDDCTGTKPCAKVDDDGDGASACTDCDDTNPAVRPGAAESCDGADNDCNGEIDDGAVCKPVQPIGSPVTVCAGQNWTPTITAGGGHFAVGCVANASQNETPFVKVLDHAGTVLATNSLLLTEGYYYGEVQLSHHDGRFQSIYQYNCDDNGSWNVGWGWGCIDFREFSTDGKAIGSSLVFGQIGHNGHPTLDYNGAGFGVAWVSYDDVFFRQIDANRQLVGGDKKANQLVLSTTYDDRDHARTHLAWDGNGYGIFSILGNQLHFARVDAAGAVVVPKKVFGYAYSQTFGGQFQVEFIDGAYYVLYREGNYAQQGPYKINLMKVDLGGNVLATYNVLTTNADVRFPQMIVKGGQFYVFSHDESNRGVVTVVDTSGQIIEPKSGVFANGPMYSPMPAYDPETGDLAVAYIDGGSYKGAIRLQQLSDAP